MAYPFESKLLDSYLTAKRDLVYKILVVQCRLHQYEHGCDRYVETMRELTTLRNKENELKEKNALTPRNIDVFLSYAERKVSQFEHAFPKPVTVRECSHKKSERRVKTHGNLSQHVVVQCLICGADIESVQKSDAPNWEYLPEFNQKLRDDRNARIMEWKEQREVVYLNAIGLKPMSKFDSDAFKTKFTSIYSVPFNPGSCKHEHQEFTIRTLRNGSTSVVSQCTTCGKHIKNVPKNSITDLALLNPFDQLKKEALEAIYNAYYVFYLECKNREEKIHIENELKVRRNTKISPSKTRQTGYYNSDEWSKTRERIFARDDFVCQSCGKGAECVHHITYERFGEENDLDLISLCKACHYEVHQRQNSVSYEYILTPTEISTLNQWQFSQDECT